MSVHVHAPHVPARTLRSIITPAVTAKTPPPPPPRVTAVLTEDLTVPAAFQIETCFDQMSDNTWSERAVAVGKMVQQSGK